jgi:UTP--glucose-1-phosphate uridylyltransferase
MKPVSGADIAAGKAFALGDIVEKPSVEEAPSDLAVAGRYLLDSRIFTYLADQAAGVGGEIQLTDAIRRMLAERPVFGYVYPGKRQDIGNPDGYYAALSAFRKDKAE